MQVAAVVLFAEETRRAVVASLHNVQRYTIKVDAGVAGHDGMLAREYIEPGPFNSFIGDARPYCTLMIASGLAGVKNYFTLTPGVRRRGGRIGACCKSFCRVLRLILQEIRVDPRAYNLSWIEHYSGKVEGCQLVEEFREGFAQIHVSTKLMIPEISLSSCTVE